MSRGTKPELEKTLKPILDLAGASLRILTDSQSYSDILKTLNASTAPKQMATDTDIEGEIFSQSFQSYSKQDMPLSWWLDLINWFRQLKLPFARVAIRVLGGMIARMPAEENAFAYRDAICELCFDVCWKTGDQTQDASSVITEWKRCIGDRGIELKAMRETCSKEIKAKYDPSSLFGEGQDDELSGLNDEIDLLAKF